MICLLSKFQIDDFFLAERTCIHCWIYVMCVIKKTNKFSLGRLNTLKRLCHQPLSFSHPCHQPCSRNMFLCVLHPISFFLICTICLFLSFCSPYVLRSSHNHTSPSSSISHYLFFFFRSSLGLFRQICDAYAQKIKSNINAAIWHILYIRYLIDQFLSVHMYHADYEKKNPSE